MKKLLTFLACLFLSSSLHASNPTMTTLFQPVNLVGDSLAGCIPLTSALCYSNYDYGIYGLISEPHPFLGGARTWKKGTESNANLASVFGIEVNPTDETAVPYEPVEIHIKDWDIPAYSPHTKAEVLAATIHCILRRCRATEEKPLIIKIVAENKKDLEWASPFEKEYSNTSFIGQKEFHPTPVGDSFIKTDGFGVSYVISKKLNPEARTPSALPVILPFVLSDYAADGEVPKFAPFWTRSASANGPDKPLRFMEFPRAHFYNIFTSSGMFSHEANPLLVNDQRFNIHATVESEFVEVSMTFWEQPLRSQTSGILAAAMNCKLHYGKPMRITVDSTPEVIAKYLTTKDWEEFKTNTKTQATAILEYDPKEQELSLGTLPRARVPQLSQDDSADDLKSLPEE